MQEQRQRYYNKYICRARNASKMSDDGIHIPSSSIESEWQEAISPSSSMEFPCRSRFLDSITQFSKY